MRSFLTQSAKELKQGGIRAFFDKAQKYEDAIFLGIGEPDLATPGPVIEAGYQAMLNGHTHYTANAGELPVREQVSEYLRNYGADYAAQGEIIMTCGGMGAVAMCLLCTVEEGVGVMVQDPQWLNYLSQIRFAKGTPILVPVRQEENFSLKADAIESRITPETKVLMINSPNNPTGAVIDKEDLEAIAQVAIRHDLLVISDEVYCELLYDGRKHKTIAAIPGMKERTVIINSFSKSFAMTGWRVGFAAGPEEIISKMTVLQENLVACAPAFGQWAAKYALESRCELDKMRAMYERRRNLMVDGLNQIKGISCRTPQGAFYVFADISGLGMTSLEAAEKILEEAHVVVTPGSAFGDGGEGFLRLSYANSEENIEKALDRIQRCLE